MKDKDITSRSWSDSVPVDRYAKKGVGLYQVSGSSTGPGLSCSGAALLKVSGNPLSTIAGDVGVGLAALGAVGVAGAGVAAAAKAAKPSRSIEQWTTDQLEAQANKDQAQTPGEGADERTAENIEFGAWLVGASGPFGCMTFALSALLLTTGAMIGGGGAAPLRAGASRLPRARFGPRISIVGLLGGLLGGLGVGVLLQQYAVLFPTRSIAIVELAIGLALGLVVPTIGRTIAVRKINGAITRAEQRLAKGRARA